MQNRVDKLNLQLKQEKEAFEEEYEVQGKNVREMESQIDKLGSEKRLAVAQCDNELKQITSQLAQLRTRQAEETRRVAAEIQGMCEKVLTHKMQVTEVLRALAAGLEDHKTGLQNASLLN